MLRRINRWFRVKKKTTPYVPTELDIKVMFRVDKLPERDRTGPVIGRIRQEVQAKLEKKLR